jgi:hypothetical protein
VVVRCGVLAHIATAFGLVELPYPIGQQLLGHRWTMPSEGLEVSAFQVVVCHEEGLDFVQSLWLQVY